MPEPITVTIITHNAAAQLADCLTSVGFADEVLVIDSGSTDATVTIAQQHRARVLHQDWLGFGPQKQFAVTQARNRWVLCLDADERVSDALRAAIQAELTAPKFKAYRMARCNRFMGRWLRHGEGYPDWSLRLFDREHARWSDDTIHEKVVTQTPVGTLRGDLLHESETGIGDYLAKQNRYTTLQAQVLHGRGARGSVVKMLLNPVFRFIKFYFFRGGFLDGVAGLVHVSIGCFNTFCKYAKLAELRRQQQR
jgi:glycosyltransferase involved in cell wall biosynthesis